MCQLGLDVYFLKRLLLMVMTIHLHTLRKIVCEYLNFSALCLILFVILFQLSVNRGLFAT
jgi:hypothetical protein